MNPVSTTPPNHQQLYEIAEQQAGYFTAAQAQSDHHTVMEDKRYVQKEETKTPEAPS